MPELVSMKAGAKAQALLSPALHTVWLLILGNWTGLVINAQTLKIHVSVCLWDFLKFLVFNSTAVTTTIAINDWVGEGHYEEETSVCLFSLVSDDVGR